MRGVPAGGKHRPSFLFDLGEAADFDDESVLALAVDGLEELGKIDGVLGAIGKELLDDGLVAWNLSLATKQEMEAWRPKVAAFLLHLSPHFLEKPAHKVLEWMVRKWRVNEVFIDELMASILPFHETVPFVRMVQIVYFTDDSTWAFLRERVKQSGHTISRTLLAQRCAVDSNILSIAMNAWEKIQQISLTTPNYKYGSTYTSFVTFLLLETFSHLSHHSQPSDLHIIRFYQIAESMVLPDSSSSDSIAGAAMILVSLCERAELQEAAIESFVCKILAKNTSSPETQRVALLVLARLVEAGSITTLSKHVIERITEIPTPILHEIVRGFSMRIFASLLKDRLEAIEPRSSPVESHLSILC